MRVSEKGIELIKEFEGCSLKAYYCPSGVLTIGYGHTKNVYEGQVITKKDAEELLKLDLINYSIADNYGQFNQNQFDALTSFAFNCGIGALKEVIKSGNITKQMALYINGNNGPLEGLVRRRKAEIKLFNTPVDVKPNYKTYKELGQATVLPNVLNVRSEPNTNKNNIVAQYYKGEIFNYNEVHITNGYVWVKYTSWQGKTRYVASRKIDNSEIYLKCV